MKGNIQNKIEVLYLKIIIFMSIFFLLIISYLNFHNLNILVLTILVVDSTILIYLLCQYINKNEITKNFVIFNIYFLYLNVSCLCFLLFTYSYGDAIIGKMNVFNNLLDIQNLFLGLELKNWGMVLSLFSFYYIMYVRLEVYKYSLIDFVRSFFPKLNLKVELPWYYEDYKLFVRITWVYYYLVFIDVICIMISGGLYWVIRYDLFEPFLLYVYFFFHYLQFIIVILSIFIFCIYIWEQLVIYHINYYRDDLYLDENGVLKKKDEKNNK